MEYCPYGPLQSILKEDDVVQPRRLIAWAKEIALGMQYLHTHKIIHRDLKSPKYVYALPISFVIVFLIFFNFILQYFNW